MGTQEKQKYAAEKVHKRLPDEADLLSETKAHLSIFYVWIRIQDCRALEPIPDWFLAAKEKGKKKIESRLMGQNNSQR